MEPFPQHPKSGPGLDPPQAQYSHGQTAQQLQLTPEQNFHHSELTPGPQAQHSRGQTAQQLQLTPEQNFHQSQLTPGLPLQQPNLTQGPSFQQPPQFTSGPSPQGLQPTIKPIAQQDHSIPKPKKGGRKKIKIVHIEDDRSRQVTFLKRKNGILKKAHELSVLCGVDVHAMVFNNDNGKLYEYFNSSAQDTFLRYASFHGPRERRRSDVTDPKKPKFVTLPAKSADIPIEEPALANAATRAASMAAIRHAHPENYEHPAPHLKRIHPNVGVPAVQLSRNPTPGHPEISRNSSLAGNSSRNNIIPPAAIPGTSSMHRSRAGASRRPTPENVPRAAQITPASAPDRFQSREHPVQSSSTRKSTPGPSRRPTPVNVPQDVHARAVQVAPAAQGTRMSGHMEHRSTAARALPLTRPSLFRLGEQRISPRTGSNLIRARYGSSSIERKSSLNQVDNGRPLNVLNRTEHKGPTFDATLQRQSFDSTCTLLSHEPAVPLLSHVGNELTIPNGRPEIDISMINNLQAPPAGLDFFANTRSINPAAVSTQSQASPTSMLSSWSERDSAPHQSTSNTPVDEPWNNAFFKEQMQHFQGEHQDLPALSPFLAELQHHVLGHTDDNNSLLHEAALDALSSPSNAALGHSNQNSSISAGVVRGRDAYEPSNNEDSKRRRLE